LGAFPLFQLFSDAPAHLFPTLHIYPQPNRKKEKKNMRSWLVISMKILSLCSVLGAVLHVKAQAVASDASSVLLRGRSMQEQQQPNSDENVDPLICRLETYDVSSRSAVNNHRFVVCRPLNADNIASPLEYRLTPEPTAEVMKQIFQPGQHMAVVSLDQATIEEATAQVVVHDWRRISLLPELTLQQLSLRSSSHGRRRRLQPSMGKFTLLPILITTSDGKSPTYTPDELFSYLFTGPGSVKNQYYDCSFGQLTIEPTAMKVMEVSIDQTVWDGNNDAGVLANAATIQALRSIQSRVDPTMASLDDYADLIMFVTPEMPKDWVAYANIDGGRSFFNNEWAGVLSTVMHELG
jgi:hypothetical protein